MVSISVAKLFWNFAEHGSDTAMLSAKYQNNFDNWKMNFEQIRIHEICFKVCIGGIAYIATAPGGLKSS